MPLRPQWRQPRLRHRHHRRRHHRLRHRRRRHHRRRHHQHQDPFRPRSRPAPLLDFRPDRLRHRYSEGPRYRVRRHSPRAHRSRSISRPRPPARCRKHIPPRFLRRSAASQRTRRRPGTGLAPPPGILPTWSYWSTARTSQTDPTRRASRRSAPSRGAGQSIVSYRSCCPWPRRVLATGVQASSTSSNRYPGSTQGSSGRDTRGAGALPCRRALPRSASGAR